MERAIVSRGLPVGIIAAAQWTDDPESFVGDRAERTMGGGGRRSHSGGCGSVVGVDSQTPQPSRSGIIQQPDCTDGQIGCGVEAGLTGRLRTRVQHDSTGIADAWLIASVRRKDKESL